MNPETPGQNRCEERRERQRQGEAKEMDGWFNEEEKLTDWCVMEGYLYNEKAWLIYEGERDKGKAKRERGREEKRDRQTNKQIDLSRQDSDKQTDRQI